MEIIDLPDPDEILVCDVTGPCRAMTRALAGDVLRRLECAPAIRADVVAGARQRLASGATPTDDEVADALVRRLVAERLA